MSLAFPSPGHQLTRPDSGAIPLPRSCVDPSLKVPVAVNCCVCPVPTPGLLGSTVMEINAGGEVSRTVIVTVSVPMVCPSPTIRTTTCVPIGIVTVGVAPLATPNGPVHVNAMTEPSGSNDEEPSSVTDAPAAPVASTL
jgi:hypothetical protein